jgi:hypothetical protein
MSGKKYRRKAPVEKSADETLEKELRVLSDQDWYLNDIPMFVFREWTRWVIISGSARTKGEIRIASSTVYGTASTTRTSRFATRSVIALSQDRCVRVAASAVRCGVVRRAAPGSGEAAANPLLYHLLFGRQRGWRTERLTRIADFLPSGNAPAGCPAGVVVNVIIPVYRGLAETKLCLQSAGRIIVIDDRSPESELSAWLTMSGTLGLLLPPMPGCKRRESMM